MDSGIFLSGHLLNSDGKFTSFRQLKRKCPAITKTNFLMYKGVLKGIREYQRAKEIVLIDCSKHIKQKHGFILKREIILFSL